MKNKLRENVKKSIDMLSQTLLRWIVLDYVKKGFF